MRKYTTSTVDNVHLEKSYNDNNNLLEEDHCIGDTKLQVTQALQDGIDDKKNTIGKQKKYFKRNDGTRELVTSNDTIRNLEDSSK